VIRKAAAKPKRKSGRGPRARVPEWKKLEEGVAEYYRKLAETEPIIYHRFYDTKASVNMFLPAQPGDHLVVKDGKAIVIETKHSVKHLSLVACFKSAVSPEQLAFARLWTRAGAAYWFLFKGTSGVELWSGSLLYQHHVKGTKLNRLEVTHLTAELNEMLDFILNID
jgi:hypothetical protein